MDARQMVVYWLAQSWNRVADGLDWLHPEERVLFGRFRFAKKQRDWLLGRWTVKQALRAYFKDTDPGLEPDRIAVLSAADGAPEVYLDGRPLGATLSLSHSNGMGLCAIGPQEMKVGCDLEKIEPRSQALVNDFFTPREQEMVNRAGEGQAPLVANLIWSGKESALKALKTGLRMDTRKVEIKIEGGEDHSAWNSFGIDLKTPPVKFYGRWKTAGGFVQTIVCDQAGFILEELA